MSFQNQPLPEENKPIQTTTTTITSTNPVQTKVYHTEAYNTVGISNVDDNRNKSTLRDDVHQTNLRDDVNKSNVKEDVHKVEQRKMDVLLNNACDMLTEVFNKNVYPDNRIPINLFQNCKGIMFLRIWKAGIGIGGISGSGVVLAHYNQAWSQPCAVTLGGIQIGVNLGVERVDDVLLLRDDAALRLFSEKGHFKLGLDASIAVGSFGVDSNTSIAMGGNETKSIYAYSFAKGAFFGVSLDGGVLSIDNKVNEEYYGRKINVNDIFGGNFVAPENNCFIKLQQLLNSYCFSPEKVVNVRNVENVNPVI